MGNSKALTTNFKPNDCEVFMTKWKYALIKIEHESIGSDNHCELVEVVYEAGAGNNILGFNRARIASIQELERAHKDVLSDGINTFFLNNGTFSPSEDGFWEWTPNSSYLAEQELYAVYGGD